MSSRQWVLYLGCLTPLLLLAACDEGEPEQGGGDWTNVCIDADGDSYGLQCPAGPDCDDSDRTVFTGCGQCDKPNDDCPCAPGSAPLDCMETPEVSSSGVLFCKVGTRYCRDGTWSACEGLNSFSAPSPNELLGRRSSALLGVDASTTCGNNPCTPDCFEVEDPIDVMGGDGGMNMDGGIAYTSNGSITVGGSNTDAATNAADELTPVPPCASLTDKDCDGIPDSLDPYPSEKPFASDHPTIFMDLAPGQSGSNTFDLRFFLKTADIYFLLDMTGSMDDEKNNLISSLKTGRYLNNPDTAANEETLTECADTDFNGAPNDDLKSKGIAGNIACLIRSAGFGAGWYREIPYNSTDTYGINYASTPDLEPYEHRQDIVFDATAVDKVSAALDTFVTRGNKNWAESGGVALSAVATGGPIYMGWDRPGIPPRTCPAGRFGYPCFRDDAMPIVILITDAPLMNGPVPPQGNLGASNIGSIVQPVNYDARGLAYTNLSSDAKYYPVSGNETYASAYVVPDVHTTFKTYTGSTRGMAADIYTANHPMACGLFPPTTSGSPGYPDAVFRFAVTDASKKVTISTRGTRFKPVLSVFPVGNVAASPFTNVTGSGNPTAATAKDLGVLGSNIALSIRGDTTSSTYSTGELNRAMVAECLRDLDMNVTAPDAYYKFTVASDVNNVTFAISGDSFSPILALYEGVPTLTETSLYSRYNDRFFETDSTYSSGDRNAPGAINGKSTWFTYGSTNKSGIGRDYADSLFKGVDPSCVDVVGTADDGVIDFQVTGSSARTVRIETTGYENPLAIPSFRHAIGLFSRPNASNGSFSTTNAACNHDGLYAGRSFIEKSLNPGTYSVVVRGERRWGSSIDDTGSYGLLLSDTTARPVGCMLQGASSSFKANLKAGVTYYLVMRGQKTGRGAHTITMTNASNAHCEYDNTIYPEKTNPNEPEYDMGSAELLDLSLPVGEYYVVLKGKENISTQASGESGRGWYQLTIGDRTLAVNNQTATMPQWGTATSGIQKELLDKGVRVITVSSVKACSGCSGGAASANTALQQQADIISRTTKAISTTEDTRSFDIYNNGTGLGFSIVNAISRLTNNVAMDVAVRLVQAPDTPTKSFQFTSRAIDTPGDLCAAPVDTNGDNIPDTHKQCTPGAVPRFQITIKNPAAPNNVPPNPTPGSNGGYNMRIEMIADNKYVIDSTPVFVIPQDVIPDPPSYIYGATGVYAQDIASACVSGTDRPTWQYLEWHDTMPADTSMIWRVCAGENVTELNTCQTNNAWNTIATMTRGAGSCTTSATCTNGYCASGVCHFPVAAAMSCSVADDCGSEAVCDSNTCKYTANPVSLLPALKSSQNGKKMLRVQVQLNSSPDRLRAPTVHDFKVKYVCSPGV